MTKQACQVTSVQLKEVLKVCQGCHNLNHTVKQPVVTESSSSILSSASDEEDASESGPGEQTQQPVTCSRLAPLALRAVWRTHIQGGPEERRTMKHHT